VSVNSLLRKSRKSGKKPIKNKQQSRNSNGCH
jgi:hypothetical protein